MEVISHEQNKRAVGGSYLHNKILNQTFKLSQILAVYHVELNGVFRVLIRKIKGLHKYISMLSGKTFKLCFEGLRDAKFLNHLQEAAFIDLIIILLRHFY